MAARTVCINPCLPNFDLELPIPFGGTSITPGGNFTLKGGCSGCELVLNMYLQIAPFLMSLGLPLCLLKCLSSVVKVVRALPKAIVGDLPDPPDPTELIDAVADIPAECACVLALILPIDLFCAFAGLILGFLKLIVSIVKCLRSLMEHLFTINLKVFGLEGDPVIEIQQSAECLGYLASVEQATLALQFNAIKEVFKLLAGVFALFEDVIPDYPPEAKFSAILTALTNFNTQITGPSVATADILEFINDFLEVMEGPINPPPPSDTEPPPGVIPALDWMIGKVCP